MSMADEELLARLAADVEVKRIAYQHAKDRLREARGFNGAKRICCRCQRPISNHHKWRHVMLDEHTALEHRNCNEPGRY